jgi:hypothetical protein
MSQRKPRLDLSSDFMMHVLGLKFKPQVCIHAPGPQSVQIVQNGALLPLIKYHQQALFSGCKRAPKRTKRTPGTTEGSWATST